MDRGQLGFLTLPWSRGVCVLDERTLIITGDHTALAFSQAPFGALAKLLDGTRTRAALFLEAQSFATEAELESMLAELAGANCLITIPSGPRSAAEIIELSGGPATDPPVLEVSVMSVGGVMSGHVEELLTGSGLLLSPSAPLGIVLVDDYLRPGTREAIERLVSEGRSCLLCSPYGASPKLGPLFGPASRACYACLAERMALHRNVELALRSSRARILRRESSAAYALSPVPRLLGLETLKWCAGARATRILSEVLTFDWRTSETTWHRLPSCSEGCPSAQAATPRLVPLEINARHTAAPADRFRSGGDTWLAVRHNVSPITGILPAFNSRATFTGASETTVYGALPIPAPRTRPFSFAQPQRVTVAGTASDLQQAQVACVAEAIERYSAIFRGSEPRILARHRDIAEAAVDPHVLLGFSASQYASRTAWNAAHGPDHHIPEPLPADAPVEWSPAWSLTSGCWKWAPSGHCYLRYVPPAPPIHFPSDTNGLGAGSCLEEAIVQGLYELIERDAIAIWWYNRLQLQAAPADLMPKSKDAARRFAALDRTLWFLNLTTDLNIPVIAALSADSAGGKISIGFGCHLQPAVALSRAYSELCYTLEDTSGQSRTNSSPERDWWMRNASLSSQPWLSPACPADNRFSTSGSCDLAEDIRLCVRLLSERNLEALALDLTQEGLGLNVARVLVPGLCHKWSRFAPGRLYQTPVELGWLLKPHTESELNPVPFFM